MKPIFSIFLLCLGSLLFSQTGSITFTVTDQFSGRAVPATVSSEKLDKTYSGEGTITVADIPVGVYNFIISAEGFQLSEVRDINIIPNQNIAYPVQLVAEAGRQLDEVVISRRVYKTNAESPLSLRTITSEEVQKNAGSNRDISKALLSLPGVGSTATFRNDLFIRGGSSAENVFYVDGIEVPIINHFQTQGASGGPRGLLTIDFIKDVDFYSGAFPAKRDGTLSSLFEFNLKEARRDKMGYKAVLGLDDMQLMADGPLTKDQSWSGLFSVRKSNLQLLFKAIGLPFLPSYYDTNIKVSKKFSSGDELYFIGLGAIDEFKLNDNFKNTLANQTLIERLPIAPQWNYTVGAGYRHLAENGNWLFTLSRNMLDNKAKKYYRNIETPENLLSDYHSREMENKIRIDRNFRIQDWKMGAGINASYNTYFNASNLRSVQESGFVNDRYRADLDLFQYGLYLQTSKKLLDNALEVSLGIGTDGSNYSSLTSDLSKQLSPRLSLRYAIDNAWAVNFNAGRYFMLPPYTALGFQIGNERVNQNQLKYIQNTQWVGGVEFNAPDNLRITAETYYKKYKNYPFSLRNQISLANLGGDFGVLGAEPLDSRGTGETYGLELLAQKRTTNNFYGIAAYTFGHSRFSDAQGNLQPSSWDSRHILTLTAGKYFKRNWNIGARFRLQSGLPETPYDLQTSSLVQVWNVSNGPLTQFSALNSLRGNTVHQLDIRAEKKWTFSNWQLTFYVDVVNVYGSANPSNLPVVALERDANGNGIITNPNAPAQEQRYQLNFGENDRTIPLPYFGLIAEF